MEYNKLFATSSVVFIVLASALVFAQEVAEPQISEVAVFTTDGRICRGFVDSNECAKVECNTGHSAQSCPIPEDQTCWVKIDEENSECISFGCGEGSANQCIEEPIEPEVEVIVPPQIREVSIFSATDRKSCKAWLAENAEGTRCAYAECYDGDTKLGGTDIICPTDALSDYPEGLEAKPCIVSIDKDGNPCVNYSCSGFSAPGTRAYKTACLDQYVESQKTEPKVVFLKNKTVVLNNIDLLKTMFERIKLNATNLADYYNSIGDISNYQKFISIANSANSIINTLNELRLIFIGIEDLVNISQEEQTRILDLVNVMKQEMGSIKEQLGGA
jgi:hypothetical protein